MAISPCRPCMGWQGFCCDGGTVVRQLERIPYEEAREWFWIRTGVWLIPAYIVNAMATFAYAGTLIEDFKTRTTVALLCALAITLLGLLSAVLSIPLPWMRLGRRRLWPLNTLACTLIAAFSAVALSGIILTIIGGQGTEYVAGHPVYDTARSLMEVGVVATAFWGAAFGSWFALRLDRYFVESF